MSTITIQPAGRLAAGVRSAIDDHAERRLGSPGNAASHTLHVEAIGGRS
jgi:hypothetical protein